jgi:hypothetical protein
LADRSTRYCLGSTVNGFVKRSKTLTILLANNQNARYREGHCNQKGAGRRAYGVRSTWVKWVTEQPFSKLEEYTQGPGRDGLNLDSDHC